MRAVEGGLRQAAEGFGDLCGGDAASVVERFASEKLREHGCASERGNAALGFEAHGGNFGVFQAGGEAKKVAADGIGDVDHGRCVRQIAGVARIFEMVEDGGRVHEKEVYS